MKALLSLALFVTACGGAHAASNDDGSLVLETRSVTLAPGEERYTCFASSIDEAKAVTGARPALDGIALHHWAVLVSNDDGASDDCSAIDRAHVLFSGEGRAAPALVVPDGVGLTIEPKTRVFVELHLLNTSTAPVTFPAGNVTLVTSDDPRLIRAQTFDVASAPFTIPPRGTAHVTSTARTTSALSHVFAIAPATRALGFHVKISADGEPAPLLDAQMTDGSALVVPVAASIDASREIDVTCDFDNPSESAVTSGASANDETCAAQLFYYE